MFHTWWLLPLQLLWSGKDTQTHVLLQTVLKVEDSGNGPVFCETPIWVCVPKQQDLDFSPQLPPTSPDQEVNHLPLFIFLSETGPQRGEHPRSHQTRAPLPKPRRGGRPGCGLGPGAWPNLGPESRSFQAPENAFKREKRTTDSGLRKCPFTG